MFDALQTMLTDKLGPLGPLYVVGLLGIGLILAVLPQMMKRQPEPFEKLKAMRQPAVELKKGQTLRRGDKVDKLQKFSAFLEPQDVETMTAARLRMVRAGYTNKNAVRMFHFAQFALGIGLLLIGLIYTIIVGQTAEVTTQFKIMATLGPGAAGYYLPQYWVTRRIGERQKQIIQGFPDALDLMLVCIEAGQSLDQSINRMARETRMGYPALADELDIVSHEVKAGKERVTVLKDMAERVNVPDVSSFVTTLVQSATYGTSIAEALRVYSSEMRDKRVMRAEEKANTLPTKLTLGTMLFTVPPLMIILIGPSVMGIQKMLSMGSN
ncbi:type II secretion system F family protein [Rhodobacter sp. KR11]|jgi:tight adherence protein C|uniref:type II secretion system F family protein n=1 Tax=Rhodobacter sp. KR11 TaxID=2974588 RepID=UPI0022224484|nr:type II secretion system F family protein [Rhodobacter sp. KR11]MCW1917377.1 type II secretion system F family protein [Rhodobacter sp. KR11]